jgi:glucosamine--fructose-6-phosphate aminotransferase (isomerizing)
MEYRGYDSVGVATVTNQIHLAKGIGKVSEVNDAKQLSKLPGNIGIGHTRWATHGKVCEVNAHPHLVGQVAIVHNGIIENYHELQNKYNFQFQSQTDSEVIACLLDYHYKQTSSVKAAIMRTVSELKGRYAFIALFADGTLAAARYHEPLVIGMAIFGVFLASDVIGFITHTDDAIYLDNQEFVIVHPQNIEIYNFLGKIVKHKIVKLSKELADVNKEDYAHFTLKEIHEQPDKILKVGQTYETAIEKAVDEIKKTKSVYITGSGTSYNAALIAKHLFSNFVAIDAIISSESQFSEQRFDKKSVLIAISQSGESADVLDTVHLAKNKEMKIIAIVNNPKSSLAQLADIVIGLGCGTEIGVAATKSFTAQLAILYKIHEKLSSTEFNQQEISLGMKETFQCENKIKDLARNLKEIQDIYVLGRGVHFPLASEASLKLKELAYIHAEGLAAGELKHGPLALMDQYAYIILLNPEDVTHLHMLNSASQIKSRGAKIIGISNKHNSIYDYWIKIPTINKNYYPFLEIIPIQLLAYYLAIEKNADPDYPRNLAKSVTTH